MDRERFKNDIINKKVISDLKVINALLANVRLKRVKKMAKSGSYISNLNITKNDPIKISQDHDNILNILGIQIEDLFFIDSKNMKGTDITISEINNMKLYQYNGVYIFALDKTNVSIKEIENSNDFIKTKRGLYYVYNN